MSVGCLLCARELHPFPPQVPNARGFERALLCRWHFRDSLDPEWFGIGPAAYWERLARLNNELPNQTISRAFCTQGYFSLLLELSSGGLLLIYPQNESALFSYVPKRLRAPERPSGLTLLPNDTALADAPKPGLTALLAPDVALSRVSFEVDAEGYPNEKILRLWLTDGHSVAFQGAGWVAFGSNPEDVCDLEITKRGIGYGV
jgi:hypothetical protein